MSRILETQLRRQGCDAACWCLLVFDRRSEGKKLPWDERVKWERHGDVTVLGC
jgi:hypothetical protein